MTSDGRTLVEKQSLYGIDDRSEALTLFEFVHPGLFYGDDGCVEVIFHMRDDGQNVYLSLRAENFDAEGDLINQLESFRRFKEAVDDAFDRFEGQTNRLCRKLAQNRESQQRLVFEDDEN